ncbi:hypothetical protein [Aquimarina rhabdastrellae]
MKPLNYKERKRSTVQFVIVFVVCLFVVFWSSFVSLYTGKKGIEVLEKKHAEYNEVFEKQAAITFDMDNIIKMLYQLKNKKRTLNEHKQFQGLISNLRRDIETKIIITEELIDAEQFQLYKELLAQIKEIQTTVDNYENEAEEYLYNKELLEKCREKYRAIELKTKK